MRPEFLAFQAFGSYRERVEIDFSLLSDDGIFLICGPTGGGKTTILDAMSVALYGKATGSLRGESWQMLRCRSAERSQDTIIDFRFSVGNEHYRFYRRWRIGKSAGEDVLKDAENACYRRVGDDYELIASGKATTLRLEAERILGLGHGQFVKVICLPQGEFRELLTSDSSERAKILDSLFGTTRWKAIARLASMRANEIDNQLSGAHERRDAILAAAQMDSMSALTAALGESESAHAQAVRDADELAARLDAAEKELTLAISLDDKFARLGKAREELSSLSARCEEMDALGRELSLYKRLAQVIPKRDALSDALAEKAKAQTHRDNCATLSDTSVTALSKAAADYDKVAAMREDGIRIQEQISSLRDALGRITQLENSKLELARLSKELAETENDISSTATDIDELDKRIAAGNTYIAECDEIIARAAEISSQYLEAKGVCDSFSALTQLEEQHALAVAELAAPTSEVESLKQVYLDAKLACDALEALHRADVSYSLSLQLSDDAPCPVCGSVHHPSPALPAPDAPDEAALSRARDAMQAAKARYDDALLLLGEKQAAVSLKAEQVEQQRALCASYGVTREDALARLAQLEATNTEIGKRTEQRLRAKQRLDLLANELAEKRERAEQLASLRASRLAALSAEQGRHEALSSQLPGDSEGRKSIERALYDTQQKKNALDANIKRIEDTYNEARLTSERVTAQLGAANAALTAACERAERLSRELTAACEQHGVSSEELSSHTLPDAEVIASKRERLEEYNTSVASLRSSVSELTRELSGIDRPDRERIQTARDEINLSLRQAIERRTGHQMRIKTLSGYIETIDKINSGIETLEAQYSSARRMSNYLCGINPKKTPIDQFVIGLLLDEIIAAANIYFDTLSRGQYALRRSDTVSGRKHYQGVNFEVVDSHIGDARPIASLSGGEIFLASLSLAFGLSDVVQGFSGGVRLDSLFIDEGFGSLDHDTLGIAIRAISKIREGRMIGIISHVEELRGRISSRIEITRGDYGSRLSIIT
ncbi:MAG: SMC family ATPase [Clostridia bacterium]|nr:SMC family ATPase [Clostridia bacterium]